MVGKGARRFVGAGLLLGAAGLCAVAGCDDAGSGGGGPGLGGSGVVSGSPVDESSFATTYADAVCEALASCCQTLAAGFDMAACKQEGKAEVTDALASAKSKGRAYDASAGGTCVATASSYLRSCDFTRPADDAIDTACEHVFRGAVPLGGSCSSRSDCASTSATCSSIATASGSGPIVTKTVCVEEVLVDEGAACSSTPNEQNQVLRCRSGLSCDGASGKCVSRPGPGSKCLLGVLCDASSYCDSASGTCLARMPLGASCTSSQCVDGATCDSAKKTCVSQGVKMCASAGF